MRVAILSDTHLPRGERRLPAACVDLLIAAEVIVHAGDFTSTAVLRELESYGETVAVHGNVDDRELQRLLPSSTLLDLGGTKIAVLHDAGPARGRLQRMRKRFPDASAVIFGHSHMPLHELADDGFQIFNPGSPIERRRAPHLTMGVLELSRGRPVFRLITLD